MNEISRRNFLKGSAGAGALVVSLSLSPKILAADVDHSGNVTPCLRFDDDGNIFLCVPIPDMGQGMITTAAQIIADEMDLDIAATKIEMMAFQGHVDAEGRAVEGPMPQGAGGSLSTMTVWGPLRRTAAYARELFIHAAASHWQVPPTHIETENGEVVDRRQGTRAPYRDLVAYTQNAAWTVLAESAKPKAAEQRKIVGSDQPNVHSREVVRGQPLFGIDAEVPDMLHAVIRRCPHLNGTLVSYDRNALLAQPGVRHVMEMQRFPEDRATPKIVASGIAIIADSYWQARKAADSAEIVWDGAVSAADGSDQMKARMAEHLVSGELAGSKKGGNIDAAFENAAQVLEATYYHPHWAHTNIEPHNCIADVKEDAAEIWVSHQSITESMNAAARATGLKINQIKSNVLRCGTGLGRKYAPDFVMEACLVSKEISAPVKVTWSREDEMEQDLLNPSAMYKLRASLDEDGALTGWHLRSAADGWIRIAAQEPPVGLIENYLGEWGFIENNVSRGAWRGPQHNTAAWVIQSFIDELAHAAGKDPLEFLLALYSRKEALKLETWPYPLLEFARFREMLETVAQDADYGRAMPEGWGQGISIYHTFSGTCAHVVEVEMLGDRDFRVHKVTSVIDCGLAVNPLGVRAQVESGINDGLCAAKYGEFLFDAGTPATTNFDTYRKMRIGEAPPEINVRIMDFGDDKPRGTGEVALPPFIPALTNAIFAASGKRVRSLPISKNL